MYLCMGSGTATGQASPFRCTITPDHPAFCAAERTPVPGGWAESVVATVSSMVKSASPSHWLILKCEGFQPSNQRASRQAS